MTDHHNRLRSRLRWLSVIGALATAAMGHFAMTPQKAHATWTVGNPIVTYWGSGPLTATVAQQAYNGGYNLVPVSSIDQLHLLDQLNATYHYGLRAQLYVPDMYWYSDADFNSLVDQFKASPSSPELRRRQSPG